MRRFVDFIQMSVNINRCGIGRGGALKPENAPRSESMAMNSAGVRTRVVRIISVFLAAAVMAGLALGLQWRWTITVPLGIAVYLAARFIGETLVHTDTVAKK
jgi:hypothetical protein